MGGWVRQVSGLSTLRHRAPPLREKVESVWVIRKV